MRVAVAFALLLLGTVGFAQEVPPEPSTTTLRGKVTGPDGAPVAKAVIMVALPNDARIRSTLTDADGAFVFEGLPEGTPEVSVMAEGFGQQVTWAPTSRRRPGVIDVRLERPGVVRGRVTLPEGVTGAQIVVRIDSGHLHPFGWPCQPDGSFEMRGPAGRVQLVAVDALPTPGFAALAQVDVVAGESVEVNFALQPVGPLVVAVTDATGAKAENALVVVQLVPGGSPPWLKRESTKGGEARLTGVLPGTYRLLVAARSDGCTLLERDLVVTPGPQRIELQLPATGAARGVVTRHDGSPAASASVGLVVRGTVVDVSTNAEGAFEVVGLAPGTHVLHARTRAPFGTHVPTEIGRGEVTVAAGGVAEVALRLQPAPRLEGRVLAHDDSPLAGTAVQVECADTPNTTLVLTADDQGRFTTELTMFGEYRLTLDERRVRFVAHDLGLEAGHVPPRVVSVMSSEGALVELQLVPGAAPR